jgi:type IV pilus assembly protein PilM
MALRQAITQAGIRSHKVSVSLAGLDTIVRQFEMPILPKREWSEAVRFEAQKYVPFDVRGLEYDMDISVDKAHKIMSVRFVAAKKEIVAGVLETLRLAGLEGCVIEPVSLSFARALLLKAAPKASEVAALLSVDQQGTLNWVIVRGRSLLMARESALSRSDANSARQISGFDPESLLSEVRLSLSYFEKHFKGAQVSRILLCADQAAAWSQVLRSSLGLPVELRDPIRDLQGRGASTLSMVGAVGVALRAVLREPGKRFNLMPAEAGTQASVPKLSREDGQRLILKSALAGLLLAAGGVAASYLPLKAQSDQAARRLEAIRRSAPSLQNLQAPATLAEAESLEASLRANRSTLAELIDQRISLTAKLNAIVTTIPPGVWLTRVDFWDRRLPGTSGQVSLRLEGTAYLEGDTDDVVVVNRLTSALAEHQAFMHGLERVAIDNIRADEANEVEITNFVLQAHSKDLKF